MLSSFEVQWAWERESEGLKSPKSLEKKSPGPSVSVFPEVRKKSWKRSKSQKKVWKPSWRLFGPFLENFQTFKTVGPEGPGDLLKIILRLLASGLETPLSGPRRSTEPQVYLQLKLCVSREGTQTAETESGVLKAKGSPSEVQKPSSSGQLVHVVGTYSVTIIFRPETIHNKKRRTKLSFLGWIFCRIWGKHFPDIFCTLQQKHPLLRISRIVLESSVMECVGLSLIKSMKGFGRNRMSDIEQAPSRSNSKMSEHQCGWVKLLEIRQMRSA